MKKKYIKPVLESINACVETQLLSDSGDYIAIDRVATNLDDLDGFGGAGDATFGD